MHGIEVDLSPWEECLFHEGVHCRVAGVSRDAPTGMELRRENTGAVVDNLEARSQVTELLGQSAVAGPGTQRNQQNMDFKTLRQRFEHHSRAHRRPAGG